MKNKTVQELTKTTASAQTFPVKGLVLSGGASTRMGRDKGDLIYYDQPQKYHLATLLNGLGLDTYISIGKNQDIPEKFQYITDRYEHIGPMAGILSAFERHRVAWLVVGCDYPLIGSQHLSQLLLQRDAHKAATVFLDERSGFLLPTIAVYEPVFFPVLEESIRSGDYSLQTALKKSDIKIVKTQDRAFKSIDTPAEYVAIKKEIDQFYS